MISGAGASLQEYCGVSYYVGGLFMALLVFVAFAFGLEKLIDIVGLMGPLIIGFSIFIAICTITANFGDLMVGNIDVSRLVTSKPTDSWWMSGILYVAYNVVSSIAFLMALWTRCKICPRGGGRRYHGRGTADGHCYIYELCAAFPFGFN